MVLCHPACIYTKKRNYIYTGTCVYVRLLYVYIRKNNTYIHIYMIPCVYVWLLYICTRTYTHVWMDIFLFTFYVSLNYFSVYVLFIAVHGFIPFHVLLFISVFISYLFQLFISVLFISVLFLIYLSIHLLFISVFY